MTIPNESRGGSAAQSPEAGQRPVAPAGVGERALPEQSREDTDAAWGEYTIDADDRLSRDRPPHWDDC